MTAIVPLATSTDGTLLLGERNVLELMATGAHLSVVLTALCSVIDEQSGLTSSIYLLDRDGQQLGFAAGPHVPDAWRDATTSFAALPTNGTCGSAVNQRRSVIVDDVDSSPLLCPAWRTAAAEARIASLWSTPFFSKDGRVLGTFAVYDDARAAPSDQRLLLVERATRLASIVVEWHQAETGLRESEHRVRTVVDTLPIGVTVTDGEGNIVLTNPAARRIWTDTIPSGPERYARSKGWWHATGRPVAPDDWPSARARLRGETTTNEIIDIEAFDGRAKTVAVSAAPLRDLEDRITGAVFSLEDVSAQKQAERELHDSLAQMRALSGRLMRAQDDERRRIAQMLHETTAQDLAALKMLLARLSRTVGSTLADVDRSALTESIELAERSMTGVRTLSYLLHPPFLDETGLVSALQWYAEGFSARSGVLVELDLPSSFERLDQDVETALFRVVQEALINVHRHASSLHATIRLRRTEDGLTLEVEDSGRGMPTGLLQQLPAGGGVLGVGVAGMRERLQQLGGTLDIESGEQGTVVRARVPQVGQPA